LILFRDPHVCLETVGIAHHIHFLLRLPRRVYQAFSTENIDYRQRAETLTIEQRIRHEINAPAFIDLCDQRPFEPMRLCNATVWTVAPQIESGLEVYPVHFLVIEEKSFPAQQGVDAPVSVSHPRHGNIPDPYQKQCVIPSCRDIPACRTRKRDHHAGALLTDPVRVFKMLDDDTLAGGHQNFFAGHPEASACPN